MERYICYMERNEENLESESSEFLFRGKIIEIWKMFDGLCRLRIVYQFWKNFSRKLVLSESGECIRFKRKERRGKGPAA